MHTQWLRNLARVPDRNECVFTERRGEAEAEKPLVILHAKHVPMLKM